MHARIKDTDERSKLSKSVTVIIVTFHSENVIAASLDSIPKGIPVIVVDNASRDETTNIVKSHNSKLFLIELERNLGFGRACNIGLSKVNTPYACLLNPDCRLNEYSLSLLVSIAEKNNDIGIIGPNYQQSENTLPQILVKNEIIAAAMLIRMSHLKISGYFDENFFMFGEDLELCARMRDHGFLVCEATQAHVFHLEGKSTKVDDYSPQVRERLRGQSMGYLFCARRGYFFGRLMCARKIIVYSIQYIKLIFFRKSSEAESLKQRLVGILDFLIHGNTILFKNSLAFRPRRLNNEFN
jgi:N-acetylglucosaminyl-diphospho-decaprenol L-rhamnosyltransferase